MKIKAELTQEDLKALIHAEVERQLGHRIDINPNMIRIEVKASQNYKAEWEVGEFRAKVEIDA